MIGSRSRRCSLPLRKRSSLHQCRTHRWAWSMVTVQVLIAATCVFGALGAKPPHVVMVVADDLGWFNAGFTQQLALPDTTAPRLHQLAASGAVLGRLYSFFYCSPARSAVLSGRLPVHVFDAAPTLRLNVVNRSTAATTGIYGIPPGMSTIATALRSTHESHMVGKYDVGFADKSQMPTSRGFKSFYGYLGGQVDYWSAEAANIFACTPAAGKRIVDLWADDKPALRIPGFGTCEGHDAVTCGDANASCYLESIFVKRVASIIAAYAETRASNTSGGTKKLFLYYGQHVAHAPLQAPESVLDRFSALKNANRRIYAAQVAVCDSAVGDVVDTLHQHELWSQTLFLFFSDNGGPAFAGGPPSASNFPLRGSKLSDWDGGVRVAGLVAGGFLTAHTTRPAGVVLSGLMHVADFFATICTAAGISMPDNDVVVSSLPELDSVSMWSYWTGSQQQSPRTELQISAQTLLRSINATMLNTSANRLLKLMVGDVPYACWSGIDFPKGDAADRCSRVEHCGSDGCLYDVLADESERHPITTAVATKAGMVARLNELNLARFEPNRGVPDPAACEAANKYGGVAGPWIGVASPPPTPTTLS